MSYPGLAIFDCDGVLVDSEVIDARIRSECFQAEGFPITAQELARSPRIRPRYSRRLERDPDA
jgi:beta-phosphoglucomutase-like phosphatase (HAD superfamily)